MWKEVISSILGVICGLVVLSSNARGGGDTLKEYWKRPIPHQPNPEPHSPNPKPSFYPEACGECHKEQYNDWQGSLHSKSVGPGLLGQLNPNDDPESALSCYHCHAPMSEQAEVKEEWSGRVPTEGGRGQESGDKDYERNPLFDNRLKLSGVSCSVCHLRGGKVYGPLVKADLKHETLNQKHGFIERDFFERAEFCAVCHQLDEGYELNSKPLTNTYREWKESFYGRNGIHCQNCHMPERRHLWRGIHDPDIVKKGVSIDAVRDGDKAKLIVTNTGAGHYFPTYVTPLVVVRGYMQDNKGSIIPESVKVRYIGRRTSLDLSREFFDTRIAPQGRFEFTYEVNQAYNKYRLVFEVWVYPDEFYNRFYKEVLDNPDISIIKEEIEKALLMTERSGYLLYRKVL